MSSMAMLLVLAAGQVAGPTASGAPIGTAAAPATCASDADPNAIVVCGQQAGPSPRLPMRDDRFAAGEVVRHPGEVPRADAGGSPVGGLANSGNLGRTVVKAVAGIRSLITGEDPGF